MKKILINYADKMYYGAQKLNSKTGLELGGFSDVIEYSTKDIDDIFYIKNRLILQASQGAGFWLWKPYIIFKTLETMNSEDILFYCDSGASFISSFDDYLFDLCLEDDKGLILFTDDHPNIKYTKRDCFHYMGCDYPPYINIPILTAGFQLCRKTKFVLDFYKEHLKFAEDPRIITNMPNQCGKQNYPEFIAHRHDQSILTILKQKYDVRTIEDPSGFGNSRREEEYKQLINLHRNRN